jgi:hypothetical protein
MHGCMFSDSRAAWKFRRMKNIFSGGAAEK